MGALGVMLALHARGSGTANGQVIDLSDTQGAVRWLGRAGTADSHAVQRDLGLTEQEIAALTSSGIVGMPQDTEEKT